MGVQTDRRERISLIEAIATCARGSSVFSCVLPRSLGMRSALLGAVPRGLDEVTGLGNEFLGHWDAPSATRVPAPRAGYGNAVLLELRPAM